MVKRRRRLAPRLGPARRRRPRQAVLRLQGPLAAPSISCGRLSDGLDRLGWGVYQCDHEDANFQFEVNFRYADALETADRLIFFRMMAGQLARRAGAIATFMAKPFSSRTGSGAHMHYHLADASDSSNLFRDESDAARPGPLGRWPITSSAACSSMRRRSAAVTSPTVNCYKRLQMGPALTGSRSGYTWTPAFITFGDNNRTQMLRIPEPGHVEDRSISSGVQPVSRHRRLSRRGPRRHRAPARPRRAQPRQPLHGRPRDHGPPRRPDAPPEPARSPGPLESDAVVREGLGPIADEFLRLKRDEWREYHAQVESWEVRRYLTAL